MEIKGADFIKSIKEKQEKDQLRARLEEIGNKETSSANSNNPYSYEEEIDQTESELDDIMLGAKETEGNENNKKKYIILGLILAVLFLITIIIFRLLTNQTSPDDSFVENSEKISQDKTLGGEDNIEQQYQKIINEKLNSIQKQDKKTELEQKVINESLNLDSIQEEERNITQSKAQKAEEEKAEQLKKYILEIAEQEKVAKLKAARELAVNKEASRVENNKVVQKTVKKVVATPKTKVVKKATNNISTNVTGTFIQIGSFSKPLEQKYLDNIKNNGFKYKLTKVIVNTKTYTRVLIGPYKSRIEAQKNINLIKEKLNVKTAYVQTYKVF